MVKINKKHIFIVVSTVIVFSLAYPQVIFENYLNDQKLKYGILEKRDRVSFIPIAIWYWFKNDKHIPYSIVPYLEMGVTSLGLIRIYDEYIFYCYYSSIEKKCIEKEFPDYKKCVKSPNPNSSSFER
jgi:hypothetical protein